MDMGWYVNFCFRCSADFSFCKRYDSTLPVTSVNSIYEDADKNIWVTLWERGLHRYNSKQTHLLLCLILEF